ncbi:MAG: hypothetical protein H6737_23775 [Alphaproteobacteria bacterium]|nr:hypothetical protein [Alphaproteobacteria bacterium]
MNLLLVLAACRTPMPVDSDDPSPDEPLPPLVELDAHTRSGTRLEAVAWEGPDGVVYSSGFYDTELGMHCTFNRSGPDTWHCLPSSGLSIGGAYADATCEGPFVLAIAYPTCDVGAYEAFWTGNPCDGHIVVYEPVEPIDVEGDPRYIQGGGECVEGPVWGQAPTFTAEGPTSPDIFAEGIASVASVDGDAFALSIRGVDGSRETRNAVTRDGEWCRARLTEDAGMRCLPIFATRGAQRFSDPLCSVALGKRYRESCQLEGVASEEVGDETRLWTYGPEISRSAPIFQLDDGACRQVEQEVDFAYHPLRFRVDASQYPIAVERVIGSDIQQVWTLTASDARVAPGFEGLMYRGEECALAVLDGGEDAVCVPTRAEALAELEHFADDGCTVPLSERDDRLVSDITFPELCDFAGLATVTRVLQPTAEHTDAVWQRVGADCVADLYPPPTLYALEEVELPVLTRVPPQ